MNETNSFLGANKTDKRILAGSATVNNLLYSKVAKGYGAIIKY